MGQILRTIIKKKEELETGRSIRSMHMADVIWNKFSYFKTQGLVPSISQAIHLCIFFGLEKFIKEMENHSRILDYNTKISDASSHNGDPDVVFIYAGKGKYKKYKEVK